MSDGNNVITLSDHQEPVVYVVEIHHGFDGEVQTYLGGVDLSDARSRNVIADTLEGLVGKLRAETNGFRPLDREEGGS